MTYRLYTTQLQAGSGVIDETLILLDLWQPGMDSNTLINIALDSGIFPNITFRRLKNLVGECFKPRYLVQDGAPAYLLKNLKDRLPKQELEQLMFLYTCRANTILYDFVTEVYWSAYSSGHNQLSNNDSRDFVTRANQDGKTQKPWSEGTINRVAAYLTNSCSDFGLLERATKSSKQILTFRIQSRVAVILAYELHFSGLGDNNVLSNPDWTLFGLDRNDVLDEFKRLALQDWMIVQTAGDIIQISWNFHSMEGLTDVLAEK